MTDDRHMDETQPDQTVAADDLPEPRREPAGFGDLPMQPTGSGVADEETAYEQAVIGAPPAGTAGAGNEGVTPPAVDGGQPAVGEENVRETRNTEF